MHHLFGRMLPSVAVVDVDAAGNLAAFGVDDRDGPCVEVRDVGFRVAQKVHVAGRSESPDRAGDFGRPPVDGENDARIVDDYIDRVAPYDRRLRHVAQRDSVGTVKNIVRSVFVGDQRAVRDIVVA